MLQFEHQGRMAFDFDTWPLMPSARVIHLRRCSIFLAVKVNLLVPGIGPEDMA